MAENTPPRCLQNVLEVQTSDLHDRPLASRVRFAAPSHRLFDATLVPLECAVSPPLSRILRFFFRPSFSRFRSRFFLSCCAAVAARATVPARGSGLAICIDCSPLSTVLLSPTRAAACYYTPPTIRSHCRSHTHLRLVSPFRPAVSPPRSLRTLSAGFTAVLALRDCTTWKDLGVPPYRFSLISASRYPSRASASRLGVLALDRHTTRCARSLIPLPPTPVRFPNHG